MQKRKLRMCVPTMMSAFFFAAMFSGLIVSFAHAQEVEVYRSNDDLSELLEEQPAVDFVGFRSALPTVTVDHKRTYQRMDGFGASLNECSCWLISNLKDYDRKSLMEKLFDPQKGIGLSFLRQPIGSSDFLFDYYSYDDVPSGQKDPNLKEFSIDRDRRYIIPLLREARRLNPRLKIMASPWSPPAWMKTSGSMIGGGLKKSSYAPLANYFVKFVQAYEAAGVPIYAVTPQNEPLYMPDNYQGMNLTASEEARFIGTYLGPAFRGAGIETKIMAFDHNWGTPEYPIAVLRNRKAASFIAGTAMHCYKGIPAAQTELHNLFPGKDIWMTECAYQQRGEQNIESSLHGAMPIIIDAVNNWSRSVVLWNLALDPHDSYHTCPSGKNSGLVTIDTRTPSPEAVMTADYAALGHMSKFVVPGAFHIAADVSGGSVESTAFLNPDGSIVLVVWNGKNAPFSFNVGWQEKYFSYSLPADSAVTFRWKP